MKDHSNEYDQLFKEYLKICNRALEANKDSFPYKQIWGATENFLEDHSIKLAVYDDMPKGCYSLHLKDKKIQSSDNCDVSDAKDAWRVNLSYLQHVVKNPDEYIDHPAKLDWDWLRNRMGV